MSDQPLSLADLVEFVTERLARYKHPKALGIVDALPHNPAGNVRESSAHCSVPIAQVPTGRLVLGGRSVGALAGLGTLYVQRGLYERLYQLQLRGQEDRKIA